MKPKKKGAPSSKTGLQPWAVFSLRLSIALLALYHGFPKLINWPYATTLFQSIGLPGFIGPIIGGIEVFAGLALIFGLYHLIASIALGLISLLTLALIEWPRLWSEGQLMSVGIEKHILVISIVFFLITSGPGKIVASLKKT